MGRFYKTSAATPSDFMYELPKEAMMQAMQTTDANITNTEQSLVALNDFLKLNANKKDKGKADEIIGGYRKSIDEVTDAISKDPLSYYKEANKIRTLGRSIKDDFTTGDAFKIQTAYDTRAANLKSLNKAYEEDPDLYQYNDINKLMALNDARYKGYESGYQSNMLNPFVDINDAEELAKGYKPETSETLEAFPHDGKLYTRKDYKEEVDPNAIRNDILNHLLTDDKLNQYYGQQMQLGNIKENEYLNKIALTADRLAEKYGYKNTSKGYTSIKNDAASVARLTAKLQSELNNPGANSTPGSIYYESILTKYNPGGIVEPTLADVDATIQDINTNQELAKTTVTDFAEEAGIIVPEEIQNEILAGDFDGLIGLKNDQGKTIAPALIGEQQTKFDALRLEERILDKIKLKAGKSTDATAYLKAAKKVNILETDADFQTNGIVHEDQTENFNTHMKILRKEISGTKGWYKNPMKFDTKSLDALPEELKELYKLKDGDSFQRLINDGHIKVDLKKIGKEATTRTVQGEGGRTITVDGKPVDIYSPETTFTNFEVNGDFAKPTTGLNAQGGAMIQIEFTLDGNTIIAYMEESAIHNKTVTQYMDMDAMNAANQVNQAIMNGVIDETPFDIGGVSFTQKNGVTTGNNSTLTVPQSIKRIALDLKARREELYK